MNLQLAGIAVALALGLNRNEQDLPPGVATLRSRLLRSEKVDVDALGIRQFVAMISKDHGVAIDISLADLRTVGLTDEVRLSLQGEQPLDESIWQYLVMRSEHLTYVLREDPNTKQPSLVITTWRGARKRGETPETSPAHAKAIAHLLGANTAAQYRAILVLGQFGKHALEVAPQLEPFLKSTDKTLRDAAEKSLMQIRGE